MDRGGDLPALEEILVSGISGELQPVLPPVTSSNWKADATGKNPGKLGIFWWHNVDVEAERVHLPREHYHHDEYRELLAEVGEDVGVVGVPTTHPPKSSEGFLVAGPPDTDGTFRHSLFTADEAASAATADQLRSGEDRSTDRRAVRAGTAAVLATPETYLPEAGA